MLTIIFELALCAVLGYGAYTDLKFRQIENVTGALVIAIALTYWYYTGEIHNSIDITHVCVVIGVFVVLVVPYTLTDNIIGGADVKLLTALAFVMNVERFIDFVFWLALAYIVCWFFFKLWPQLALEADEQFTKMPLGVPIFMGSAVVSAQVLFGGTI